MNMKIINMRVLATLVLCVFALWAQAQPKASVDVQLTNATNAVEVSQVQHALKGAGAKYTFSLTGETDSIRQVTTATYTLVGPNGSTNGTVTVKLSKGVVSFDPVTIAASAMAAPGEYILTFSLQYNRGKWNEQVTQQSMTASAQTVHIWDTPSVSQIEPLKFEVVHNARITSMRINAIGGYDPEGWKYEWSTGASANSIDYTASNTGTAVKTENVKVSVTNFAPNGSTQWFAKKDYTYNISVYPTPTVVQNLTSVDMYHNQSLELKVTPTGGAANGWTYQWSEGTSKTNTYTYKASNTGSTKVTKTVTVTVSNKAAAGTELFKQSYTFTIDVYPAPTSSPSTATTFNNVPNGEYRDLGVTASGGNPNGWTYTWSDGVTTPTNHYQAINTTNSTKTDKVTVTVVNRSPDGTQWYSKTHTFTLTITAVPFATLSDVPTDVINGDKVTLKWNLTGGLNDYWKYLWKLNGTQKATTQTYEYTGVNNNDNGSVTDKIETTASYVPNSTLYSNPQTRNVTVWATPKIKSQSSSTITTCGGRSESMSITTQGGVSNGWKFQWYNGNTAISGATGASYTPTLTNNGTTITTATYRVKATNTCAGKERFSETRSFTVQVYPAPKAITSVTYDGKVTTACYVSDKVTLAVSGNGGNPDGWTFKWDDGNSGSSTTKTMPSSVTNNPTNNTYYVTATNSYNGIQWYNQQVPVTVNVYNRGTVTKVSMDSTHFLAGKPIAMKSNVTGGYPSGWSYSWKEGSINISGNASSNTVTATNSSSSTNYIDKVYTLTAVNKIGDNVGSTTTLTYNARIWPAMKTPANFTISAMSTGNKVREGDRITCLVDQATGGYNNSWQYRWTRNGQGVATGRSWYETAQLQNSGSTMATEDVAYGLNISQNGPYDHLWADKDYSTTIKVYRCPMMPDKVVRKGNGTTHTLIVMTGEDENTMLTARQYTYRFGYTDNNGIDHMSEPVARRYFQMSQSDFSNSDGNIWAVAQWKYTDGETVTSGKRFVSGDYDTSFNASSFVTPRRNYAPFVEAEESGIEDVACTAMGMVITGNRLRISFGAMTDVTVAVYDMSGHTLSSLSLPNQTQVDIALGLENLPRGMYVVEMRAGDKREVQKVVIR